MPDHAAMKNPPPSEIVALRKAAKLTQPQAAALVHYSRAQWQKWEGGEHGMPLTAWELFTLKVRLPGARTLGASPRADNAVHET